MSTSATAASFLASPPPGFFRANETLNALPASIVSGMVADALRVAAGDRGVSVPVARHLAAIAALSNGSSSSSPPASTVSATDLESALHALLFIAREASSRKLNATALEAALTSRSELSAAIRAEFVRQYAEALQADGTLLGSTAAATGLRLGQLVALDWKVGVGLASSDCAALGAPFVSLKLRVADASGKERTHALELTLEQFRELESNFEQIAAQLETV